MAVLDEGDYRGIVESFNEWDDEAVVNLVPNAASWDWMADQVPFLDCPDEDLREIYYFRWWALRKHLKQVGDYYVYTEFIELDTKAWFIPPERTIASALGHHFMETRWLVDQSKDDSYLDYWMVGKDGGPQGHFHRYSSWLYDALWQRYLVTGDKAFIADRFDRFEADYKLWQEEKQLESGLYWQADVWDAMEESISGGRHEKNVRPTINSYMFGNAVALSNMAALVGKHEKADAYHAEAEAQRKRVLDTLWSEELTFFESVKETGGFANVREAIGFIPWYFNLPTKGNGYEEAWKQVLDPEGFSAPYGLTTAEQRHPEFRSHGTGYCEWDGAIWPYATSQTLVAMGNVIRNYEQEVVSKEDFYDAFLSYTRAQRKNGLPYIGEYQDEQTGEWLKGDNPRSKFYHHSTYADLLIANLIGIRPQDSNRVVIDPLLPESVWDWFCLDGVPYRGHMLTVIWDKTGQHYGKGAGLTLMVDGAVVSQSRELGRLEGTL
ncbi:glycoside hydrolase [Pelagicoccus sp. NFK12]|uniref:Glycoside hydrolase n=1 Tax=Pelagicoccus enzymogenes TaxID=2773457 RepID=A0A927F9M5_9BACT|nr:glycoside hydrolase [Pelagicoccus enzymogenes]